MDYNPCLICFQMIELSVSVHLIDIVCVSAHHSKRTCYPAHTQQLVSQADDLFSEICVLFFLPAICHAFHCLCHIST